jgi:hypothetical protein
MMLSVDTENGQILIGSPPKALPGILDSVEIGGALSMESSSMQGSSGATRTVHGWGDADLSISLTLIDDPGKKVTRYESLAKVTGVFKKVADDGGPELYVLQHPMVSAWGIRKLLFSDLKSVESRGKQKIKINLQFVEHESTVAAIQQRQTQAATAQADATEAAVQEPRVSAQMQRRLSAMEARLEQF